MDFVKILPYIQIGAACITILMPLVIWPISRLINKVRTNDLHHLDLKIDEHHKLVVLEMGKLQAVMEVKTAEVQRSVGEVSHKLDTHLQWHLGPSRIER
jgi:hypothetical protein